MSVGESLLDTFPGRLFIEDMRSRGGLAVPVRLIRAATRAVSGYLYSDRYLEVANLDVDDPELRSYDVAGLAALTGLATFGSPQIHQGTIGELRAPRIGNREPLSVLPAGAFWTSTPITEDEDSWTLCGENLRREMPRWEVHFDVSRARVARIDSARDWADLIDANTVTAGGRKYPDWPAIAETCDAVHLSAAGLLLAHPNIATTRFGCYVGVGEWSTVSTAWLREPPNWRLAPMPRPE
ncbi:hypothetical protein AWB92_28520 [Mycobacterium sp. IEC1808]|uniref:hypothetical protein n=1 Tax=Mycobacterium sp. IEC1808 TaxID=1743230 RepID=UPI000A16164C|nr:hypothetical protein [Mycobacterium sp. IEC1808]ORW84881.1 hypothetical protein AWB92_28520 [Mycobacterium sp. IEC1808]